MGKFFEFLRLWRDFLEHRRNLLLDQQLLEAPRTTPRKKRTYRIKQVHTVELDVEVGSTRELQAWDEAVHITLETPDGALISTHDPAFLAIQSYQEHPTEFLRLDAPEHPSAPPRETVIVEEPVIKNIGVVARIDGRDCTYCIRCEHRIPPENDYTWYIAQDQTNDGSYYVCCACKRTFL